MTPRRAGRPGRTRGPVWLAGGIAAALLVAGLIVTFDVPGLETITPLTPVPAGAGAGAGAGTAAGAAAAAIPAALEREARPIGRGPRFRPAAPVRVAGGCAPGLGGRFAIHLELFAADRVVLIPAGIGVGRPWRTDAGRIAGGRCYGRFVTVDPTGVVQVAFAGRATLGDLFAAWGERLGSRRLLSFRGRVRVYADGHRVAVAPPRLTLSGHYEIVLEVGPYVPPHASYTFPPPPRPGANAAAGPG